LAGIKAFAESLDTLGTLTRDARDAQYLRAALLGTAFRDETAEGPLRIGLCQTPWWDQAEEDSQVATENAALGLSAHGARVTQAVLPSSFAELPQVHASIMAYESARNYAFELAAHREALSPQLLKLLDEGCSIE